MKKTAYALVLTAGMGLFALSACNNSASTQATNVQEVTQSIGAKAGHVNEHNLTFTNEAGEKVSLSDLKGKVVFINFWATWCPPCKEELPSIEALKNKMNNPDLVFLMVDVDNKIDQSTKFMTDKKLNLPVVVTEDQIPSDFLGNAIPTTVILNKKGEMVRHFVGMHDYNSPDVEAGLKELLSES